MNWILELIMKRNSVCVGDTINQYRVDRW